MIRVYNSLDRYLSTTPGIDRIPHSEASAWRLLPEHRMVLSHSEYSWNEESGYQLSTDWIVENGVIVDTISTHSRYTKYGLVHHLVNQFSTEVRNEVGPIARELRNGVISTESHGDIIENYQLWPSMEHLIIHPSYLQSLSILYSHNKWIAPSISSNYMISSEGSDRSYGLSSLLEQSQVSRIIRDEGLFYVVGTELRELVDVIQYIKNTST